MGPVSGIDLKPQRTRSVAGAPSRPCEQMPMDRLCKPEDRGHVELFGAKFGRQAEFGQDGVDSRFAKRLFYGRRSAHCARICGGE